MKNKYDEVIILTTLFLVVCVLSFINVAKVHGAEEKESRKILYYRNPMNPSITSEVPAKDNMRMDYIPVYAQEENKTTAHEEQQQGVVTLSKRDVSLAGIVSEPVMVRHLFKEIRSVGRVAYDPELYTAEEELIQAIRARKELEKSDIVEIKSRADALVEASKLKLLLNGLSQQQIDTVIQAGQPDRSLIISDQESPLSGFMDIYVNWLVRVGNL